MRADGERRAALAAAFLGVLVAATAAGPRTAAAAPAAVRAATLAAPAVAPAPAAGAPVPVPPPPAPTTAPTTRAPVPVPPPPAPTTAPATGAAGAVGSPPSAAAGSPLGPDPNAQAGSLDGPGPLVANGLGSPSCRPAQQLRAQLSAAARANCATSGVAATPVPIEHYQFDVHIDNGLLGTSPESLIANLLLKPFWMALVWLADVAVVALEWCFSLDLLGSGAFGPVARGLSTMRDALTTPWLGPVLAVAAVGLLYNGLVRRRVTDSLGQVALLLAMMIGGLWVIADPGPTVGAASQLVNQASLGALGAAATGDPDHPLRSLDDALRTVFDAAITGPWCYLEFGDVDWCREPSRLDPKLVAAARDVLAADRTAAQGADRKRNVAREAAEIAAARTNGDLFLALPSNGPRRNSINADPSNPSLLRALCGGGDATDCPADTGPQAEFRTQKGTAARMGGLVLIAVGAAGMYALLGFLSLRLLGAALLALLYLLLAPVAVLAPALGDGGRAAFRLWSLRLLGAVAAKLVYAVFLGVVLLMVRVLAELGGLGWWTQWLLIAAFWWLVFSHRHRLLETVIHERTEPTRRASLANRLFAARQAIKLASPPAKALGGVARRRMEQLRHLKDRPLELPGRRAPRQHTSALAEQVSRSLDRDHAAALATVARRPALEVELDELRARRERLRAQGGLAIASGDRRRTISLARREHDVTSRIATGERQLAAAGTAAADGEENRRRTGVVHDEAQRAGRADLLDREAELRPRVVPRSDRRVGLRDYAGLASLAGLDPGRYEHLTTAERRRAQLEIDRQLERRREWSHASRAPTPRELADRLDRRPGAGQPDDPRPPRQTLSPRERQFSRPDAPRPRDPGARRTPADQRRGRPPSSATLQPPVRRSGRRGR